MTIETQLIIGAGAFGVLSLAVSVLTLVRLRERLRTAESGAGQIEHLEESLSETRVLLEESRRLVDDHARRIAWLDAKIRQSRYFSVAGRDPANSKKTRKSSIDEQRGRVLKLAQKGQGPRTIAASLGMMPGEVELILSLNNHHAPVA